MKHKLANVLTLGEIQGEGEWLMLTPDMLGRHAFIAGGIGGGKTSLSLLIMRQLIPLGYGFSAISPHADLRTKLLHWCDVYKVPAERIVDCTPDVACCPSLDPFANMPGGLNSLQEETWLQAQCRRFMSAMLSNVPLADQEVMNQLNAWLMNSLYMCGKRVDGEYLGVDKALMLFDLDHPDHEPAMRRLLPHAPDYMRADWNVYRETKNVTQRRAMVQSTVNRYRRTTHCNPLVTQTFARRANAIKDTEIITGNKVQIVCVPETTDFPREAGNLIGRMRLSSLIAAVKQVAEKIPEHLRPYHFLIIDEAENFICEDLRTAFQELRKFHMPVIIIVQDISCLVKGEMDLIPKVAGQCGLQTTFQQQDRDSLDYLADNFSAPFIDHTMLKAYQQFAVGHEIIQTQSVSFNSSRGISVGEAHAMTQTHSVTRQNSVTRSTQQNVTLALSSSHSEGRSEGESAGGSAGLSKADTWNKGTGTSRQVTDSRAQALSQQQAQAVGVTETTTRTESNAVSHQEASNFSNTKSSQISTSNSNGTTETAATSETEGKNESTGRSGPLLGLNPSISKNVGETSSKTTNESRGSTSSTTTGSAEGRSSTEGGSVSDGTTNTVANGASHGASKTETTSQGVTNTVGQAVSEGVKTQESVGGSTTQSQQKTWTANKGRSSTDTNGVTRTAGASIGNSSGESSGESNGQSIGHTDNRSESQSSGVAVSFNQVPLPLTEIIEVETGRQVVSVQDQIARFKTCIARLPDRVMLVKVRGMDRPFLLKVHHVADPYDQKKLFVCDAWRAIKLKQYVAKIRKAHPWYFLPSLDEEPAPAPTPKERKDRRKHPELEESPLL